MLVKDSGYNLRDIRGSKGQVIRHEERNDLIAIARRFFTFLSDPEPITIYEQRKEEGMSENEVMRRLIYHDEIERIREEEQEDQMREIRRKHQSMGGP